MVLRVTRIAARLGALAIVVAALQSLGHVGRMPLWLAVVTMVGPAALALWRPFEALECLAAFVPIAAVAGYLGPTRVPFAEAITLSAFAGVIVRSVRAPLPPVPPAVWPPLVLLAVTITASLAVQLAVQQIETNHPAIFARSVLQWLTHSYFVDRFRTVHDAALLLEGLALFGLTARACAGRDGMGARLRRMVVVGTLAAAALNLVTIGIRAAHGETPIRAFVELLQTVRLNVVFGDVNAAGSQFALALGLCAGLAATRGRSRVIWILAAPLLVAGVWLTASRAAFVAITVVLLGVAARTVIASAGGMRKVAAVAGIAAAVAIVVAAPRMDIDSDMRRAMSFRVGITQTSLRMTRTHPVFGIGIGQYYPNFDRFSSPELLALYQHENAHNNFLQVLAELGAVGLACFVWLLWAACGAMIRNLMKASPPEMIGTAGGLAAFGITMLSGHPLLIPEVAYTFWLVLGTVAADGVAAAGTAPPARRSSRWVVVILAIAIALSLVVRLPAARRSADLDHASYGFGEWQSTEDGTRYRRLSGPGVFFVPADPNVWRIVGLSVRARSGTAVVTLDLDGRPANVVKVFGEWQTIYVNVPPGREPFRRVDVRVDSPVDVGRIRTLK